MRTCERCGKRHPKAYGLWDYCAYCLKNLCDDCAAIEGCCGKKPAESGMEADLGEKGWEPPKIKPEIAEESKANLTSPHGNPKSGVEKPPKLAGQ